MYLKAKSTKASCAPVSKARWILSELKTHSAVALQGTDIISKLLFFSFYFFCQLFLHKVIHIRCIHYFCLQIAENSKHHKLMEFQRQTNFPQSIPQAALHISLQQQINTTSHPASQVLKTIFLQLTQTCTFWVFSCTIQGLSVESMAECCNLDEWSLPTQAIQLHIPHPQRRSKPGWMEPWAACFSIRYGGWWPCMQQGVEASWSSSSLQPRPFCYSMNP